MARILRPAAVCDPQADRRKNGATLPDLDYPLAKPFDPPYPG